LQTATKTKTGSRMAGLNKKNTKNYTYVKLETL